MQSEWKVHWLASNWNHHLEVASIWFPSYCTLLLPNKNCWIPSPKQNQPLWNNAKVLMEWLHWQNKTTCDQNWKMFGFVVCQKTPLLSPSPQNACLLIMGLISSLKKQLKMIEVKNQPSKMEYVRFDHFLNWVGLVLRVINFNLFHLE
jgi:hypothetical protein